MISFRGSSWEFFQLTNPFTYWRPQTTGAGYLNTIALAREWISFPAPRRVRTSCYLSSASEISDKALITPLKHKS
jgi:hypothetical protein